MSELYWEPDLNEDTRDDLDGQPARKKTKVDHFALTEFGCSSLDQYNSLHYGIDDGSINSHGLTGSSMFFDSTRDPGEIVKNMDGDDDEDEDEDEREHTNETLKDGQVVGAERDEFIPEICFGMV